MLFSISDMLFLLQIRRTLPNFRLNLNSQGTLPLLRNVINEGHRNNAVRYRTVYRALKTDNVGNHHFKDKTCLMFTRLSAISRRQQFIHTEKLAEENKEAANDDSCQSGIDGPVPHALLISYLQKCNTVEEQLDTLCSTLCLTPEDIKTRIEFTNSVNTMLEPFFPGCSIQLYGSTVNTFGFKGCDIDMSLSTDGNTKELVQTHLNDIVAPMVEEVLNGKVSIEELSELPCKEKLIFIHSVFLDYYKESAVSAIFINAYIPIVRFQNDKYNLKCDLTFKNKVAHVNTKLLYAYGNMDKRVTQLMMFVRYWAKHVGLIGGGLMFNTYTLSLLVIYFLQTRNPPVVPTAETLLAIAGDGLLSEDMDDIRLLNAIKQIPPSENTQKIDELLREFFFYYLFFDYQNVVCPLIGRAVPRNEFNAEEYSKKFRMNTICIQDPIKLTHNVANLVDFKHCKKLGRELRTVCKQFQGESIWAPMSSSWGISAILDNASNDDTTAEDDNFLIFNVPMQSTQSLKSEHVSDMLKKSIKAVLDILQHALLCECTVLQKQKSVQEKTYSSVNIGVKSVEQSTKKSKNTLSKQGYLEKTNVLHSKGSNYPTVHLSDDNNSLSFCTICTCYQNTFLGRESVVLDHFPPSVLNNPLELERSISLSLSPQENSKKKQLFQFICECCASYKNEEISLSIQLKSMLNNDVNPNLGIFFKEYVPKILNKLF